MKIFIFFHIKYNYVNPFKEINDFITKIKIELFPCLIID